MAEGIAWQNKDILFKILGQTYKEKSFASYGIDLAPIREFLPTELPKISANERSIDSLFLLEDSTYVIVDYESEYKRANKIKYLNYITRVLEKYHKENRNFNLRLVVIYTGDVQSAEPDFETGCLFLQGAFRAIREKLQSGIPLSDDDLMKLVILPLTISGPTGKQHMLERVVELAEQIPDEEQRIFTLSGVIVASDKFINRDYLEQLRRRINMTQLGRLYEKEKIEYGNQKAEATAKKVTKEMALKMLEEDVDIITIMKVTGFSEDELTELQKKTSITV